MVVGPFQGEMNVTIAESYEKMVMAVPTMLLARTVLVSRSPEPGGRRHLTDESVTHDDERHGVTPICTSTDRSTGPKLMPPTVTCRGKARQGSSTKTQGEARRGGHGAGPSDRIGAAACPCWHAVAGRSGGITVVVLDDGALGCEAEVGVGESYV